ncbi:DUF1876 domain-containing protein [Saccharothrix variisporea]|uniref:Uncharacterized protein DUF1876 n=1 Tax=Saccharothrix variisporea TaxID=543527 RepID=A0A495XNQ4_9PSEU|nr:DUF1876 domain-containing protein [Saccharothrix variisporea]RKT74526.1 uncharacterized protein DUF1876 [Saccharothrix variisporea]
MNTAKTWHVEVHLDEHDGRTRAKATLTTRDGTRLTGIGLARLNPTDTDVPEIGDELATARALADLAHALLDATADDIEALTHKPADIHL